MFPFTRVCVTLATLVLLPVLAASGEPGVSEASAANEGRPSLLGTRWDFGNGSLAGWRKKDNARISLVDEGGNRALRLESSFGPFEFTWVSRSFEPRSLDGVAHVRFRVCGDGSGHSLEVQFGAFPPDTPRPLYYTNSRQAVKLDFTGWRQVSLDIEQFATPKSGLRGRDLARVGFLEFMIHAQKPNTPLDLRLDDVELVGRSPEESAEIEKRDQERKRLAAEITAALDEATQSLAGFRGELDQAAGQGKYVEVARVYWTALDWSAKDIRRSAECEELEVVRRAEPLLAGLRERIAEPRHVLGRVLDRPPDEKDRLDVAKNPFFQAVLKGIRGRADSERWWPKGRRGYLSISDAWSFRRFGDESFALVWVATRPKSPLRHHPMLVTNALNLFDVIAYQHTDGDFNVDRTAAHGYDPNINRFCLAPALDAWCELWQAYPELLPAAHRAQIEAGLRQLVEHQVSEHGLPRLARLAGRPEAKHPAYPNMDVHYLLIMELAHRLWKDPRYLKERDAFLGILEGAVYPMGAFTYVNTQNECYVYHQLDVVYLARLWQLTGEPRALALLKKTIPYYPYNVEPAGMPEYYTDACWKHYWGRGEAAGPAVIASLFDDPLNERVAETCGAIWGYERGHVAAIAAALYRPVASKPLPDHYVIFDENVQGPRGRYGPWSFAANGRNYGVGFQGKDTFVGCMLTDAARRPLPLDAALQVVTAEVRLNHTDNHWLGGRCFSAREKLSTTLGPDFGSLAVRYAVSRPHWRFDKDDLLPWEGTQQWYLSRNRLVGLVVLEATADDTRAAVHGRIRLGLKRPLEPASNSTWKYGGLLVTVHGHNYARIVAKPSETTILDKPADYRSTEITLVDPVSVAAGERGEVRFPKGTRYWFLVEVRRDDPAVAPAERVERIDRGPLVGFSFSEPGRRVVLLHNPTEQTVEADLSEALFAGPNATIYREHDGKGASAASTGRKLLAPPHHHAVITVAASGK